MTAKVPEKYKRLLAEQFGLEVHWSTITRLSKFVHGRQIRMKDQYICSKEIPRRSCLIRQFQ